MTGKPLQFSSSEKVLSNSKSNKTISIKLCKIELVKLDFELLRTFSELENCNGSPGKGLYHTRKLSVACSLGTKTLNQHKMCKEIIQKLLYNCNEI